MVDRRSVMVQTTGKICQLSSKWVRQQKKSDGLCLSYAVTTILTPYNPTAINLWEP